MARILAAGSAIGMPTRRAPAWLRVGFWACTGIAVGVGARRVAALAHPSHSGPPQLQALDAVFASHAALTLAHILPALAFVIVAPFVLLPRFARASWPTRLFYPLGFVVAATAYAMSAHPVGGWTERSAVLCFNSLFLFSLVQSLRHMRRGESALERQWQTRAVGILLGIATTRPVMGVFFASSPLTHLQPSQFFGVAFWIGFSINTAVIELWLRSWRNSVRQARSAAASL